MNFLLSILIVLVGSPAEGALSRLGNSGELPAGNSGELPAPQFFCSPCITFTDRGEVRVTSHADPNCLNPASSHIHLSFVPDARSVWQGNVYHICASLWPLLDLLHTRTRIPSNSTAHFYLPRSWRVPYFTRLFRPRLESLAASAFSAFNITFVTPGPRTKLCIPGPTFVIDQHVPFTPRIIQLVRETVHAACPAQPAGNESAASSTTPDVLIYNRERSTTKRARNIVNVDDLLEALHAQNITAVAAAVPSDPCDQVRLLSHPFKLIITPHGAQVTLFVVTDTRHTRVLELMPRHFELPLFCRISRSDESEQRRWFTMWLSEEETGLSVTDTCPVDQSHPHYFLPGCRSYAARFDGHLNLSFSLNSQNCIVGKVRDVPLVLNRYEIAEAVRLAQ